MSYFSDNYGALSYPLPTAGAGLYRAQIGAIHSISAHFSLAKTTALVTMPTGSGKTAVLMMVPFVLQGKRVLVISPSRMVRGQIAEDFSGLVTLRKAGAIPMAVRGPRVKELKERISSIGDWTALAPYDVVVSTPNCVSPGYEAIPAPPADLFDVVLIDEAHHSPSRTWDKILDSFAGARTVFFTATPFRRDRGEIKAKFIYTYSVEKAFEDGIFGRIAYVPVNLTPNDASGDIAVARRTQEVLRDDQANGLTHCVMVRTDGKARAKELLELYQAHTDLRLELIHSGISAGTVKKTLAGLEAGELDGIVCVDMLGEGFNFPRLKIAAIHAPHKSLEVTLQFIGRFARTNAADVGEAKFVAVLNDIEVEGARLFDESAVWQRLVQNLSLARIENEVDIRDALESFDEPDADADLSGLSLYSLYPRSHVKVFDVAGIDVDLTKQVHLGPRWQIRYQNSTQTGDVALFICRQRGTPKWSATDKILDSEHVLVVMFHDAERGLVFVNSSQSSDGLYEAVKKAVAPGASGLSLNEMRRVVRRLRQQRVFNYGLRNIQAANVAESYRIISGADTQLTMRSSDARLYRQGHVFLTGEVGEDRVTIGYSAGSKVWSASQLRIPALVAWCRQLGQEIRDESQVVTHTGLDLISTGAVVTELPTDIVVAQWSKDAFALDSPASVEYTDAAGQTQRRLLMDLDLGIDRSRSTDDTLYLVVSGPGLSAGVKFGVSDEATEFFVSDEDAAADSVRVVHGVESVSLTEYMNFQYPDMYTASGGALSGNDLSQANGDASPMDPGQIEPWDWTGTNIKNEVMDTTPASSIHHRVKEHLRGGNDDVVFVDHGAGEIADCVAVRRSNDAIEFVLYHCKASSQPTPGARVEDVYEVCGQAVKSAPWRSLPRIRRRLQGRLPSLEYVRGSAVLLEELLREAETKVQKHRAVIVQPGISIARLSQSLSENLGASSDHLRNAGFAPLQIIASA